eukprot:SAG31_NODE_11_length_38734_cov_21.263854_3_plen_98_part_00
MSCHPRYLPITIANFDHQSTQTDHRDIVSKIEQAGAKEEKLKQAQAEADEALQHITVAMEKAGTRKHEVTQLSKEVQEKSSLVEVWNKLCTLLEQFC